MAAAAEWARARCVFRFGARPTRVGRLPGVYLPPLGLAPPVADALTHPPEEEWALLELAVAWPDLADAEARVASRLRTFVLARDPLDHLERFAPACATANGDGDDYEVVVYVPLGNALTLAELDGTTVAEVLARLTESAVAVGAAHEQLLLAGAYPKAVRRAAAQPLLADPVADLPGADAALRLPSPTIELVSDGWEPIGLGAIQDLVQAEFGPVDLDRTTVRLTPADTATPGCPACAGEGFGFPADLQEQLEAMCASHAAEAKRVTDRRVAHAARSNRRGWAAITEGALRLEVPPPPWSLGRRLRAALEAEPPTHTGDRDGFRARVTADAQLILDLAARYGEDRAPFEHLLEGDEDLSWRLMDWLTNTLFGLGITGQDELIVPVGEALQRLDPDSAALHASDLAVALSERGHPEAVQHAEANARTHPDDPWVRIHLGDVHRNLGDPVRAEAAYREAVALVADDGEPADVIPVYERLTQLLAEQSDREDEASALEEEGITVVRRREAAKRASRRGRSGRGIPPATTPTAAPVSPPKPVSHPPRRTGPKVGRNEPCPCGSGKKYKRCHGA